MITFPQFCIFVLFLVYFSIDDMIRKRINSVAMVSFGAIGIYISYSGGIGLWNASAGASVAFIHIFFFMLFLREIWGVKYVIGGGDVWLLICMGIWFGWFLVVATMFLASVLAAVYHLIIKKDSKGLPFIPFLSFAAIVVEITMVYLTLQII